MLKWAVNGARRSYLPSVEESDTMSEKIDRDITSCSSNSLHEEGFIFGHVQKCRVKRKACNVTSHRRKVRYREKENQLTSTPLPVAVSGNSPIRKLDSLRDLSNIAPDNLFGSPYKRSSQEDIELLSPDVRPKQILKSVPSQYASTLPTFEVEYSPCALVPGPILALRGVGIADTYFEKPRYLNPEHQEPDGIQRNLAGALSNQMRNPNANFEESSIMSSSKMGDTTLERMIDAILESARKERKVPKSTKPSSCTPGMSPTYTPADDPASDLHEFWDESNEQDYQKKKTGSHPTCAVSFNEREINSNFPINNENCSIGGQEKVTFQLRRQRAVRRKQKLREATTNSTVQASAQKLLLFNGALGARRTNHISTNPSSRGVIDPLENETKTECHNISPDSGRNSSSDYEDSTLEEKNPAIDCIDITDNMFDSTKRRLTFSFNINGC